jgi:cell wall-associated NlpC family hydrolase
MKILKHTLLPILLLAMASCKHETAEPKLLAQAEPLEIVPIDNTIPLRDSIVAFAKQQLGVKYVYATADPKKGFDCSGFVNFVYRHFGIEVPRSSSGFQNLGKALKPEEFKVGDILVFYGYKDSGSIGHVGIICEANGMKSKFIHASSGSEMAVTISELGSDAYTKRFYKAISPFDL